MFFRDLISSFVYFYISFISLLHIKDIFFEFRLPCELHDAEFRYIAFAGSEHHPHQFERAL